MQEIGETDLLLEYLLVVLVFGEQLEDLLEEVDADGVIELGIDDHFQSHLQEEDVLQVDLLQLDEVLLPVRILSP